MGICGSKESSSPAGPRPTTQGRPAAPETGNKPIVAPADRKIDHPGATAPALKSESHRLGSQSDNNEPGTLGTAKELAAKAAQDRLDKLQTQNRGQLSRKLDAQRKKASKDFAMEEYNSKLKT